MSLFNFDEFYNFYISNFYSCCIPVNNDECTSSGAHTTIWETIICCNMIRVIIHKLQNEDGINSPSLVQPMHNNFALKH